MFERATFGWVRRWRKARGYRVFGVALLPHQKQNHLLPLTQLTNWRQGITTQPYIIARSRAWFSSPKKQRTSPDSRLLLETPHLSLPPSFGDLARPDPIAVC
jgi:hypothetical protein